MGPKKDPKKDAQKRDQNPTVEDPLNTDSWRCVVTMAVERTHYDSFVLKEFMEEFASGRRQEVGLIDFDTFLVKIVKEFATGDLHHRYLSLLNFSSVLQEASEYVTKNADIPVPVLAKVIKVLLFYLREDSLMKIEKKAAGPPDPILAMAERPPNFGIVDSKKKEPAKKAADNAPKVRPSSFTKEDTKLLKRGEPVKDEQRIDDAPLEGYFNLYVLLTGFYHPDLPLELLKGGVPLHGLLCIDTSLSGVKRDEPRARNRCHRPFSEGKSEAIQNFWDVFLKILWDPQASPHFKDTVFQVYVPRSLHCGKERLREFVYREISYLMYELSDLMKKLKSYLGHMKLWDVGESEWGTYAPPMGSMDVANECVSVPVVLQCVVNAICGGEEKYGTRLSADSIDSVEKESGSSEHPFSLSAQGWYGSYGLQQGWSRGLVPNSELLGVLAKTRELDAKYDLDDRNTYFPVMDRSYFEKGDSETATCDFRFPSCGENMAQALAADGTIRSYWNQYDKHVGTPFALDYCLYPLLMTRVFCKHLPDLRTAPPQSSHRSFKKTSNFHLIEDIDNQMRKPHFTVTDSSRSILRALPYNVKDTSRDFFSPHQFKVVSPEKLKASSAPQFRPRPGLKVHKPFTSQIFSRDASKDLFHDLRQFLGDGFFANVNDFDFLEFLGRAQLLDKKTAHWGNYNCIDHAYALANDCIFIALHNRMDSQHVHHETFNEALKTAVGLRDFFDYVLEDEAEWLASRQGSLHATSDDGSSPTQPGGDFSDSDFWLVDSIKYRESRRAGSGDAKDGEKGNDEAAKAKGWSGEGVHRERDVAEGKGNGHEFGAYNVSDMAVQFSGLKTVYYSDCSDCSMTVELIERLYGNQDLGIHIAAEGHTLHLYSYVCPEPHVLDPFTFHLTYRNGIVLAFTRRFVDTFEEVEEIIESKTTVKGKKNSSEVSTRVVKRLVPKKVRDEDFVYDMAASLPNGLSIRTVRRTVEPCYIAQRYLGHTEDAPRLESSRLFLPNGNVVRMLGDGTVHVLKPDTSTVTASLADLVKDGPEGLHFARFRLVSSEGRACTFEHGQITSSNRFQVLRNTDLGTDQVFFRRRDGTNYVLQSDGALCTEFGDGTRIFSSAFVTETPPAHRPPTREGESARQPADPDTDFLFVCTKTIVEHPDYATVMYDAHARQWTVLLPQDSAITVDPDGQYSVDVDGRTELRAEESVIQMNRYSSDRGLQCTATADLSVFEAGGGGVYCHMEDQRGKIFIVEANSNCYILDEELVSEDSGMPGESSGEGESELSLSEFVASADLEWSPSVQTERCSKLSRSNKYFVLRRDMTGFELLHADDVSEALSEKKRGSLIFTETIPDTENRFFVLITPETPDTCKKWQVATVLPNPKYAPNPDSNRTSSTYGCPPSWMHPFPKRKSKFHVPRPLSCRLFIETRRTRLSPPVGEVECSFCEADEVPRPAIPPDGVEEYLKKLSNNDQDLLTQMYAHVAESLINEKKKSRPVNEENLDRYLNLSRYHVELQEYHKRCIRFHTIPDYFHHPAGMSWQILNDLVSRLHLPEDPATQVPPLGIEASSRKSQQPSESTTTYSNEEIEYDLSSTGPLTFSDLTYRSDLSAQTAPPVLRTAGFCTCKITSKKVVASAPALTCSWVDETSDDDDLRATHSRTWTCHFQDNDLDRLDNRDRRVPLMTLEDLMCLGLV